MLKKLFFILIVLNILQGCGYSPMYSSNNKLIINIEEITLNGDWELNNYIKSSLERFSTKINKSFIFKEKFTMENFEDKLIEKNYERSNKQNIANLIVNKLISQLSRLE